MSIKCEIQWIDEKTGLPTPDDNPAIGTAQCMGYHLPARRGYNPNYRPQPSKLFPICEEHLQRMPRDGVWIFTPYSD